MGAEPPFPQSLCHGCRWRHLVASSTTTFLRCTRPGWPKYPPQPVRTCAGHEIAPPRAERPLTE
jgi:hypothetical protein